MGGGTLECPMGIQDNSETLLLSYTILFGLWNGSHDPAGLPTLRSELCGQGLNEVNLARELDLAEERRDAAAIRLVAY